MKDEIHKALDAATPGPWKMMDGRVYGSSTTAVEPLVCEYDKFSERDVRNAYLIANAPTWLRFLLDEVERLTELEKDTTRHLGEEIAGLEFEIRHLKIERNDYRAGYLNYEKHCESLRTELAAKDKVLEWYAEYLQDGIKENGERARSILSQYKGESQSD
jgi:hypothetical protein